MHYRNGQVGRKLKTESTIHMKAEHLQNKTKTATPRVEQEPTFGGTAAMQDHRPATAQFSKLRASMTTGARSDLAPIQGRWYSWQKTSDRKFIDKTKGTAAHEMHEIATGENQKELAENMLSDGFEKLEDTKRVKKYGKVTNEKYANPTGKSKLRTTNYYQNVDVAQYEVKDPEQRFFHSTRLSSLASIKRNGLNHMHGYNDVDFTESSVRRHTRGYVYFGFKDSTARGYARKWLKEGGARVLSFTLDAGDVFECDPELSSAGRIDKTISPDKITVLHGTTETPLTEYEIPGNIEGML